MVNETENSNKHDNEQSSESLSALLAEYRKIADLDIEQAAETLCLTVSTIKSLENEEFDKLPEPPYMRGYLRNYARFAGKDPAHIIDVYHQRAGIEKVAEVESAITASSSYNHGNEPSPVITTTRFRFALITVLLLSLILLSMIPAVRDWATKTWDGFSETTETSSNSGLATLAGNIPLPGDNTESLGLGGIVKTANTENGNSVQPANNTENAKNTTQNGQQTDSNVENPENTDTATNDQVKTADTNTENANANENADSQTDEATDEDPKSKPEGSGDTHLKLVFTDKVWLRIRNDKGKTLYEATNGAGVTKELKLNAPLKFKVGNASHLKLFVDGEEMDIRDFTRGSVATFGIE